MPKQKLTAKFVENAKAVLNRGSIRFRRKEWTAAEADFNRAIEIRPNHPNGWLNRASCRFNLRKFADAVRDAEKALGLAGLEWAHQGSAKKLLKMAREAARKP